MSKQNEQKINKLLESSTGEQRDYILSDICNISLNATPGGGKTTKSVEKIYYHYLKKELKKDEFAFICFSNASCLEVISKGKNYDKNLFNTKNVKTTYSLAGTILNSLNKIYSKQNVSVSEQVEYNEEEYDNNSKDDEDMEIKSYKTDSNISTCIPKATIAIKKLTDDNKEKVEFLKNLKVIIADEAQDYSNNDYEFIETIGKKYNIPIIMIGDPNQSIYQFRGGSAKFLRNHYIKNTGKKLNFTINFRSTQCIIDCVNELRIYEDEPEIKCGSNIKGNKPTFYNLDKENSLQEILKLCKSYINPNEITAIIGPCRLSNDKYPEKSIGLEDVRVYLKKYNIDTEIHYEINNKNNEKIIKKQTKKKQLVKGKINLLNIHISKGQEYDSLIILNFHHATMNRKPTTIKEEKKNRHLWYVAFSRAKTNLSIFSIESNYIFPSFQNLISKSLVEYKGKSNYNLATFLKEDVYQDIKTLSYNVTDLLNSRDIIDERKLFTLEEKIFVDTEWKQERDIVYEDKISNLPDWDILAPIYGSAAENYLEYLHNTHNPYKNKGSVCFIKPPKIIRYIHILIKNHIIIPIKLIKEYNKLCKVLSLENNIVNFDELDQEEEKIEGCDNIIYFLNSNRRKADDDNNIVCILTKPTKWLELDRLQCLLENSKNKINSMELLFMDLFILCLFQYQFDNECINLWENFKCEKFIQTFNQLEKNIIKNFSFIIKKPVSFEQNVEFSNLKIKGRYDLSTDNSIVELKFSESISSLHKMQVMFYNAMCYISKHKIFQNIQVWNLFSGEIISCKIQNIDNYISKFVDVQQTLLECITTGLHKTIWITNIDDSHSIFEAQEIHTNFYVKSKSNFKDIINKCDQPRILSKKGYPEFQTLEYFKSIGIDQENNPIVINIEKIFKDFCSMEPKQNLQEYINNYINKLYGEEVSGKLNFLTKIYKIIFAFQEDPEIKLINVLLNYNSDKE